MSVASVGSVGQTKRVLIIDDDPMIRSLLCAILKRVGYQTETASDGVMALERLNSVEDGSGYDLIFTDIRMPRLWGTDFYLRLREKYPFLAKRVVFATSESLSDELRAFFQTTGRPCIRKPFSNDEVRRLAAEVCAA